MFKEIFFENLYNNTSFALAFLSILALFVALFLYNLIKISDFLESALRRVFGKGIKLFFRLFGYDKKRESSKNLSLYLILFFLFLFWSVNLFLKAEFYLLFLLISLFIGLISFLLMSERLKKDGNTKEEERTYTKLVKKELPFGHSLDEKIEKIMEPWFFEFKLVGVFVSIFLGFLFLFLIKRGGRQSFLEVFLVAGGATVVYTFLEYKDIIKPNKKRVTHRNLLKRKVFLIKAGEVFRLIVLVGGLLLLYVWYFD